ncbi:MAG: GerMN domain-containing protein [Thermoanaerobaculia bacterium]|nr:GerMN domain-containing protein [Thermoanaerobaculia bacterium]
MTDPFSVPTPEEPDPQGEAANDTGSRSKKAWIIAVLVILAAGAAGLWLGTRQKHGDGTQVQGFETDPASHAPDETAEVPLRDAELYFVGSDGRLYTENRELPDGTPAERAHSLVDALLTGPRGGASSELRSPLPAGTRIEAVYLLGTTALLDLRPPEPESDPDEAKPVGPPTPAEARLRKLSFGAKQELLTVYSLVNTVVLGVEGVDTVQLLWDGRQPETFAGHVDTTRPLAADPSYLVTRKEP